MQEILKHADLPPSAWLSPLRFRELHHLAVRCAYVAGVPKQDLDDCASAFVLKLFLLYSRRLQENKSVHLPRAWLRRCATNHAIDFLRHLAPICAHEVQLAEEVTDEEYFASSEPTPEEHLLREECGQRIRAIVSCLTPVQQGLFERLIVDGQSASEAAVATRRDDHTVRQARYNLCKRLRVLFAQNNITEAELRGYILPTTVQRAGGLN